MSVFRTMHFRLLRATALVALAILAMACAPRAAMALQGSGEQHREPVAPANEDDWRPLFDGKSLDGWKASGELSAWQARDGELVCARPSEGGWLRTERMYRDFELSLEFLVPPGGNSGIGLRGSSNGDPAFTGMEVQILDSFGKEVADNQCGAVYNAIAPSTQACKPAGEWNAIRVLLVGDTLNLWLNDMQVQKDQKLDRRGYTHEPKNRNPLSRRLTTGYIALQDHGDPMRFRNIQVRDLSPDKDPGGWRDLIKADLSGWKKRGVGRWDVMEGTLVGSGGPGHLYLDEPGNDDFELRAHVLVHQQGDSGLFFRCRPDARNPDGFPFGYEAQIDHHDPRNFTGRLYNISRGSAIDKPITGDGAWFDYRVRAVGQHLQVWVNGVPTVDILDGYHKSGQIALETHYANNRVEFRDLQIRAIAPQSDQTLGLPRMRRVSDPLRVFYCTHSAGFKHDCLPLTRSTMLDLASRRGWFSVTLSENIADLTPAVLAQVDVVMLYTTGDLPIDVGMLARWVQAGGALVGVHSATDTLSKDERYVSLIGGIFDGHPWNEDVAITVEDRMHPALHSFSIDTPGEPTFRVADEIYQFRGLTDDRKVLMRLAPGQPRMEEGRDYPLAWTSAKGKGRVFYTALGHRPELWEDVRFQDHVLAGMRWAAWESGDRVCGKCGRPTTRVPVRYGLVPAGEGDTSTISAGCVIEAGCPATAFRCPACGTVEGLDQRLIAQPAAAQPKDTP